MTSAPPEPFLLGLPQLASLALASPWVPFLLLQLWMRPSPSRLDCTFLQSKAVGPGGGSLRARDVVGAQCTFNNLISCHTQEKAALPPTPAQGDSRAQEHVTYFLIGVAEPWCSSSIVAGRWGHFCSEKAFFVGRSV